MTVIKGYLKLIVFESANGYRICKFQLEHDRNHHIFIKGFLMEMHQDQLYELTGEVKNNPRYGQNFEVQQIKKIMPQTKDDLIRYLSSDLFPTIGAKTAEVIINHFQEDVINKIKNNLATLNDIKGLTPNQVKIIQTTFSKMTQEDEINHLFSQNNLSLQILSLLKTKYDVDQIMAILQKDPYSLLLKDNISFKAIDKIFLTFNSNPTDYIRIGYYAWYYAKEFCNSTGDTYLELEQLTKILQKNFVTVTKEIILAGLKYVKNLNLLIFKNEKIYVAEIYHSELNIAALLNSLNTNAAISVDEVNTIFQQVEAQKQISYNLQQVKAIKEAVLSNFLLIVGGPGTGKTTVVDGIVSILKKSFKNNKIILAAPTGKAAKRLRDKTKQKAVTIHKLLKYDPLTNQFFHNENNPLEIDILILDEVSMVDTLLLSAIAKASLNLKKLILIGDVNQLPSVACGDVLRDIIGTDIFNVVPLTEVYRQQEGNDILELSYAIQQDYFEYHFDNKQDVKFINSSNSNEILNTVGELYQNLVKQHQGQYDQIQIIAPMYNGTLGINTLNNYLQNKINPDYGQKHCKIGYQEFRVNDKVMQLKNRPELEVYNGDVGIIVDIKQDKDLNNILIIQFDEQLIKYSPELYYDITLAYACSVHKLQGSEYEYVIFVITKAFWIMLNRNLVYTGITRAKNQLFLLGEQQALHYAVNNVLKKRKTTLGEVIKDFKG
ncbi:SF1B family DNA helicase RecD2 [Spiroplasma chrysopicola]|uniref:ATP-dependent RecD2 DNA helicase n=1 Tax=Spiroplasma chrysopicola DF-1 TaxID=1276227 RepID=R4UAP6_9MOLU|nr:ATP-dependent RecD-like DNA helicase [Spiroplasma chrysopicola]AGM24984.1 exodeoxyribonuclease V subunit alpha [Spiroplasma chrysopicola DF-1]